MIVLIMEGIIGKSELKHKKKKKRKLPNTVDFQPMRADAIQLLTQLDS